MENHVVENDSPKVQRERIRRLVSEHSSDLRTEFYDCSYPATEIRFKLVDRSTGRISGFIPQDSEWLSSQVADKSDSELLRMVAGLLRG
jgi:hypothetical protein